MLASTDVIRSDANKFTSEANRYALGAKSLIPNINHEYINHKTGIKRLFRTNEEGTVFSNNNISDYNKTLLFLGGSTTECNEVNEDLRFTTYVENLFLKQNFPIRAINAGVRGNTTQDSIISYLNRPNFRNADFVILMHNINDRLLLSNFNDYSIPPQKYSQLSTKYIYENTKHTFLSLLNYLSYQSNILFDIKHKIFLYNAWTGEKHIKNIVNEHNIDLKENNLNKKILYYEKNIEAFISLVKSQDSIPILMTQPLEYESVSHRAFNETVKKIGYENNILVIDLEKELKKNNSWAFLSDGIHLNDAGSKAVGTIITNELNKLLNISKKDIAIQKPTHKVEDILSQCKEPPKSIDQITIAQPKLIIGKPGRYPDFSPDGQWMSFQSWNGNRNEIYIYKIKDEKLINISKLYNSDVNERHGKIIYSDDSNLKILFGSGFIPNDTNPEKLIIRSFPELNEEKIIMEKNRYGSIANFKNKIITFPSAIINKEQNNPDLFQYNIETKKMIKVTNTIYEEWRPIVDNNGKIYYIANPEKQFDIYSNYKGVTKNVYSSQDDEWDPAIDPTDRWLIFSSKVNESWNLILLDLKNNKFKMITTEVDDDWDSQFHPSGSMITFSRYNGDKTNIYGLCLFGEN
jgi:hypothetical protein